MRLLNQHYVTAAYIRAWNDPSTPNGAFVWAVDKRTKKIRRKSPRSLFSEDDFYTVIDDTGERIFELEERLSTIEQDFIDLRNKKLVNQKILEPKDREIISLFASTLYARTRFQKTEQQEMWQSLLDSVNDMPEELAKQIKQTPNYENIVKLRDQPMPFHMFNFVNMAVPFLYRMNCAILETRDEIGFITSDNPCIWIDPAVADFSRPYKYAFGLGSPTLAVQFPISPRQFIHLESQGPDGYIGVDSQPEMIATMNQLVTQNADEIVVVSRKEIREIWFEETM